MKKVVQVQGTTAKNNLYKHLLKPLKTLTFLHGDFFTLHEK